MKSNPNPNIYRHLGIVLLSYILIDRCCGYIKETNLFQHRNKKILGDLLYNVRDVIAQTKALSTLTRVAQLRNKPVDKEDMDHETETQAEAIELFYDILVTKSASELYDFVTILDQFKEGNKLYTQKEMEYAKYN